jgi:hypothetical protein
MTKLKSAWPVHLASVRSRFFDHVDPGAVEQLEDMLSAAADRLEDTPPLQHESSTRR